MNTAFRRLIPGLFLVLGMTLPGFGQTEEPAPERPERGRPDMRRPQRQDPVAFAETLKKALADEMQLTDEQKDEIDGIFEDHINDVKEAVRERDAHREETRQRQQEIRDEIRQARKDGDQERARQLMQELMDLRRGEGFQEQEEKLFADVREVLDEPQQNQFAEIVKRLRPKGPDQTPMRINYAQLVRKLDLDQETQRVISERFREMMRDMRGRGGSDPEAFEQTQKEFRQFILEHLDQAQTEKFLAEEEKMKQEMEQAKDRPAGAPDAKGSAKPAAPTDKPKGESEEPEQDDEE